MPIECPGPQVEERDMPEPVRPAPAAAPQSTSHPARWLDTKLTPGIFALFFVALALMCAAAAGIGYVTRGMRHVEVLR